MLKETESCRLKNAFLWKERVDLKNSLRPIRLLLGLVSLELVKLGYDMKLISV